MKVIHSILREIFAYSSAGIYREATKGEGGNLRIDTS